ncbi:DMT family transporter [Humitalea sp. 24SJ18S-53]|uniref:DMT family transporter n=1 Tax=Humitalea sp. 24SJ18S-53 TaxID=3422307 RepID=UPI003D66D75A
MPAAILFILIWASAFTAAAVVLREWPPFWALGLRFAVAAPILLAIVAWRSAPWPGAADWPRIGAMGALGVAGYLGFSWLAMALVPSGLVALIAATAPLFVALGERFLRGRHMQPMAWVGLGLGWAGVAVLGGVRAADGLAGAEALGLAFALAGAACQAAGILIFAPARGRVDPWAANAVQTIVSAVVLLPMALVLEGAPPAMPGPATLAGLLYSVVVVGVAGYALWFLMLRRLPAATAAALQLLAPPLAAVFGWALLSERLGVADLVGGTVTLVGLLLLFRAR